MKALLATGQPDPLVRLADTDAPQPTSDETLVRVTAFSLNRGEANALRLAEPGWAPGWDFVGIVDTPPADGTGPKSGTRVAGFAAGASWAEYVAVHPNRLAPVPNDVLDEIAAALPVAGITAVRTFDLVGPVEGRSLVVTGAAGGVGQIHVQLAHAAGAHVTAVASTAARRDFARSLGADRTVADIAEITEPVDVVFESAGGPSLAHALSIVAAGGTVVTFGNSSRSETTLNIASFYRKTRARVIAFGLTAAEEPQPFTDDLARVLAMVAEGRIELEVGRVDSWHDANVLLGLLIDRRVTGKAVLTID